MYNPIIRIHANNNAIEQCKKIYFPNKYLVLRQAR